MENLRNDQFELPEGVKWSHEASAPDRVRVGETLKAFSRYGYINTLSQIRQEINPDELNKLTRALIQIDETTQEPSINLIQPITVGLFSANELAPYLERLNATWSSSHTLEDLRPTSEGGEDYLILIAGHRRLMAIEKAAEEYLHKSSSDLDVEFSIVQGNGLTFRQAITTQYRENIHHRPESWEDAFAVNAILREGLEHGDYRTFADCARDLAINDDRVAKAYRFQTLPEEVRQLVKDKVLPYSHSLKLTELFCLLAYDRLKGNVTSEKEQEVRSKLIKNKLHLPDAVDLVAADKRADLHDAFLSHTAQVVSLKSVPKIRDYIASATRAILHNDQLMMIEMTEAQMMREEDTKLRQSQRQVAIDALKSITAILSADQNRIENDKPALLVSNPTMTALLKVVLERVDEVGGLFDQTENNAEALIAARLLEQQLLGASSKDAIDDPIFPS